MTRDDGTTASSPLPAWHPSARVVELAADLGEDPSSAGQTRDQALLALVSAVHVACGGHAGDAESMRQVVLTARRYGVVVGAHPSYPDRAGFGRRPLQMTATELVASVATQVDVLRAVCDEAGVALAHVKPHGALYHAASADRAVAAAVAEAVAQVDAALVLIGPAGSPCLTWWRDRGMATAAEGFADRTYRADGSLLDRSQSGALISDPELAVAQAMSLAHGLAVATANGESCRLGPIATLAVHADTPGCLAIAAAVRTGLVGAGLWPGRPPGAVVAPSL